MINAAKYKPILLSARGIEDSHTLSSYETREGYAGLKKTLKDMKPGEVIDEVKASSLRGRGGAGFPTGMKWGFLPDNGKPRYLCANADESEPGTFKDRFILESDPHMLIEGMIICAYACNIHLGYIYIRGEYPLGVQRCIAALKEAYEAGYLGKNILNSGFDLDIHVHKGAGAYICGDETGLIESLEGKRGYPRPKPPFFPAAVGLFHCPTIVNNVETLSNLPFILRKGAEEYSKIGPEKSPGPKMICISGHVNNPGLFEKPMGYSLKKLIYEDAGGIRNENKLKAVIPGGASTHVLTADEIDIGYDIESLKAAGSGLGSAGIIVMDETTCMVDALWNLARFYAHESCGQCTPCREGTSWVSKIIGRIEHGKASTDDIDMIVELSRNMAGRTVCPLADGASFPYISIVEKFREEFDEHVRRCKCPIKNP